jgi:hypothetical protein
MSRTSPKFAALGLIVGASAVSSKVVAGRCRRRAAPGSPGEGETCPTAAVEHRREDRRAVERRQRSQSIDPSSATKPAGR